MSKTTIKQLAETIGLSVDELIDHIVGAGLPKKTSTDEVTEQEKMTLIAYLQQRKKKSVARASSSKPTVAKRESSQPTEPLRKPSSDADDAEVRRPKIVVKRAKARKHTTSASVVRKESPQTKQTSVSRAKRAQAAVVPEELPSVPLDQPVKPPKKKDLKPKSKSNATVKSAAAAPGAPIKDSSGEPQRVPKPKSRKQLHIDSKKRTKRKKIPKIAIPKPAVKIDRDNKHAFEKPTKPVTREVMIPDTISVIELAQRLAIKRGELVKMLMNMGVMVTINQVLDQDTAILIVEELGHIAKPELKSDTEANLVQQIESDLGTQKSRPPVVVVMGHVDHGKTSLLDYIRKSQITEGEAGGITQHIGAYHVETSIGMITFLDTPGHAAFTAMRSRGAQITDIIVLVVAADDGVMPQTIEAIEHAKAADVPIIVALNKVDKEGVDAEKVKGDLAQHGIVAENWGGDNIVVEVSAKTGNNISALLESISLQAEIMELKSSDEGPAVATVVESSRDKGRGVVVTVLVRRGTLRKGDVLLAGAEYGKVRAMMDEHGQPANNIGPSIPVVVFGMSGTPAAGEEALVVDDERKARDIASRRRDQLRAKRLAITPLSGEELFGMDEERKELRVLIRADVRGTAEALRDSLEKIVSDEIKIKILSYLVGGITVSDVNLVAASGGMIVGFNVRADATARKAAEEQGVTIRYYNVIYELIDDVKNTVSEMLAPEVREEMIGLALVKDVFRSSRFGAVAGCQVTEGAVKQGNPIRVLRDNVVVFEGELESLRRHKDDVNEVKAGTECGIAVKDYDDVKAGDQIEVFQRTEVRRSV